MTRSQQAAVEALKWFAAGTGVAYAVRAGTAQVFRRSEMDAVSDDAVLTIDPVRAGMLAEIQRRRAVQP